MTTSMLVASPPWWLRPVPTAYVALFGIGTAAWLIVAVEHIPAPTSAPPGHPAMAAMSAHSLGWGLSLGTLGGFPMVAAMMAFGAAPMARYVRDRTLRRRWWATPTVVVTYFGVWLLVLTGATWILTSVHADLGVLVAVLVAAALWEVSPMKRWAIDACQRTRRLRLRGVSATASEIAFGAHQGGLCVASCWLIMLPMALTGGPQLVLTAVGTVVVTAERLTVRPDRARRVGAALLAATAVLIAFTAGKVGM